MGIVKVVYDGRTLMDVSGTTVTPEKMFSGETALGADGEMKVGTFSIDGEISQQDALIDRIKAALRGKASGGTSEGDFPGGYRRVSCIRFTGAQAVETGIKCNQNTKIRAVFTRDAAGIMYLYGYISADNTASMTGYMSDAGGYWRFGAQRISYVMPVNDSLIQTAIVTKNGITRANLDASYSTVSAFECGNTLLLGAGKYIDGSIDPALLVGRVFIFEMWDGNDQVLRLVPAVSPEGIYGFFDTVKGEFHASITDTPLLCGDL